MASDQLTPRLIKLVCIVCSLGLFIDGYVLYISSVALPFINASFHPTSFMLGLIQASAPIGATVGAIAMGRISDKIGRKSMLIFNLVFFVVVVLLSSLATGTLSLIFFRFLIGMGVGMDYPICASYMAEMTPENKTGQAMAIAMFVNCLASPVGVLVAWCLYTFHPTMDVWRWMFATGAIPALIALAFRAKLPESFLWKAHQRLAAKNKKNQSSSAAYRKMFSKSSYLKVTLGLCAAWFLMDIAYYGIGLFTPTILSALNIDGSGNFITKAGEVLKSTLYLNSIICLGALCSIFIINKINNVRLQAIGFLLSFIGLFMLAFSHSFSPMVNTSIVFTGFIMFNFFINAGPGITTYLLPAKIYPTDIRATGHGFASGCGKLGAFTGALMLPLLQEHFGIYITVCIISFALLAGYAVSTLIPADYKKHKPTNKVVNSGVNYELS